jgi:PAS domain S-box-containing protein
VRPRSSSVWKRFAVVAASVWISTLLAFALKPYLEGQAPFLPFTLAVIASAWYGGLIPGLAATALSFLVADYFLVEPTFHFLPVYPVHFALLGLYLAVGVSISVLQNALCTTNMILERTLEHLSDVVQRVEFAASEAKIGFHEFLSSEGRQIWTPEMERLFGLAPGSFEGTYDDWLKRMHPDDRETIKAERATCIRDRKSDWRYEYRAVLPNGGIRWIEGRSRLFFSKSGSIERIVGANIDVTERRELDQALAKRSEQLVRSNKELERFAYAVSHDLQEPLRGITAMTELFLERTRGALNEDSAHLLDFVLSSAGKMKRLIQDVLELGKVTHDQHRVAISPTPEAAPRISVGVRVGCVTPSRAQLSELVSPP